jgi:hypothetical protein
MNPFRSAPRPVFIPPHMPLCARLSFESDGKTLVTAAINRIDVTLRNRGRTTALFRFVATKRYELPADRLFYRETHVAVQHSPAQTTQPHFGLYIGTGAGPDVYVNVHVVPFFLGENQKRSIVRFGFRNRLGVSTSQITARLVRRHPVLFASEPRWHVNEHTFAISSGQP